MIRLGLRMAVTGGRAALTRLAIIAVAVAIGVGLLLSALAGVVYTLYNQSGNASAGMGLELDAIAAVVIGGTPLSGGVGYVLGTLIGVLILGTIQTIITFEGTLSSWWTNIATGVLLRAFILLQKAVSSRVGRRARG